MLFVDGAYRSMHSSKYLVEIHLNFSKAFDSVNRNILIDKYKFNDVMDDNNLFIQI